ncbi:MAG: DUF3526 domain-containing protein, partial [Chitinophagaceae bacterium]|nr:DUF3526 domain-containing protein [Chitinophagaceae bacterium]
MISLQKSRLLAQLVVKTVLKQKSTWILYAVTVLLVSYSLITGYQQYKYQHEIRVTYQQKARESWESNPDKHPHRMAHYGSFAFRPRHPLSFFDFGMESYTGNTVFLEAHKQNSVNFSEAGFSTGMLRFGEISMAVIVQLLFPMILFFLGFGLIASERENGTLSILLSQGARWQELLVGKSLGLFTVILLFLLPVLISSGILLAAASPYDGGALVVQRGFLLAGIYLCYLLLLSFVTVFISSISTTAKHSLLVLIGIWLVFMVLLPRGLQSLGNKLYPAPGKLAFDAAVENELIQQGDSHNPDDVHYKKLKDSILQAYQVDSVQKLPFNYSGFVMREGERISAMIYNEHQQRLWDIYRKQNSVTSWAAFVNPFIAIRNLSMSLTGTDFDAYTDFQKQAETYRYQLAQRMN